MPSCRSRSLSLPILFAAGLLLAGCGSDPSDGSRATDGSTDTGAAAVSLEDLDARQFTGASDAVDGHDLVTGTTVLLSFDGGTINAFAGCNHLFGDAEIADGVLSVTGLGGTEMGCPADRMDQDDWLIGFLSSEPTVALTAGELTVSGGGTALRLTEVEDEDGAGGAGDPDEPTSNE